MTTQKIQNKIENDAISPFVIQHIFFTTIDIRRPDFIPDDGFSFGLSAEIAIGYPSEENQLHLNLRLRSTEDSLPGLEVEIIAVGVFEYQGDGEPEDIKIVDFINNHLLTAMNSRVIQLLATTTTQMGMAPIWMPTPRHYGFDLNTYKTLLMTRQEELDL